MEQHVQQHRYLWKIRRASREVMFLLTLPHHMEDPMRQTCRYGSEEASEQARPLPEFHSYPPPLAHHYA